MKQRREVSRMNVKHYKTGITVLIFILTLGLGSFYVFSETSANIMNDSTDSSEYALTVQQGEASIASDPEAQNNRATINKNEIVGGRETDTILSVQTEIDPQEKIRTKNATSPTHNINLARAISNRYGIKVTGQDIADLRINNCLNYGEIGMMYGLANASGQTVANILTLRQQNLSWSVIAKSLELKISTITRKNNLVLKDAKMDKEVKNIKEEINKEQKDDVKNNGNNSNNGNGKENKGNSNNGNGNGGNSNGGNGKGGNGK